MKYEIEVIRSKRKTVALEIKRDLRLILRAPEKMRAKDIDAFINKNRGWIDKHMASMRQKLEKENQIPLEPFTKKQLEALKEQAKEILKEKAEYYADLLGVTYNKITIKHQISRWGSCSGKGNLNFNCLLMLCPDEVQNYVVVHELCHRKHLNHSTAYWSEVARIMPEYKTHREWLKNNGRALIMRLTAG